jgi:hypothetical protein
MSKDIIVSKLRQELGQEFVSEGQVVYVLAETRKVLEVTQSEEKYPSLRFFCDWVLHTTMSRKSAQVVLRNFDEAHALAMSGVKQDDLPPDLLARIHDTMLGKAFRMEFEAFLVEHVLPTNLTSVAVQWVMFMGLYTEIIQEAVLEVPPEKEKSFSNITGIKVTKIKGFRIEGPENEIILFGVQWEVQSKGASDVGRWQMAFSVDKDQLKQGSGSHLILGG